MACPSVLDQAVTMILQRLEVEMALAAGEEYQLLLHAATVIKGQQYALKDRDRQLAEIWEALPSLPKK